MSCIHSLEEGICKECGQPSFGSMLKMVTEYVPNQYNSFLAVMPDERRIDFHCARGFLMITPVHKIGTIDGQAYDGSMWELSLTTEYGSVRRFPVRLYHGEEEAA